MKHLSVKQLIVAAVLLIIGIVLTQRVPHGKTMPLQKDLTNFSLSSALQLLVEQLFAVAELPESRVHTEIKYVCLTGGDGKNAVSHDQLVAFEHDAGIACQQTVAKHAVTPGEFVTAPFDIRNLRNIVMHHLPHFSRDLLNGRDH